MFMHPTFVHNSWNRLVIHETLINYALRHEMLAVKMGFIDRQHPPTLRPLLVLEQRVELSISGKSITSTSTIATTRSLPTISSRLGFQWWLHLSFGMLKHGTRISKLTSGSHTTWVKRFSRFSKNRAYQLFWSQTQHSVTQRTGCPCQNLVLLTSYATNAFLWSFGYWKKEASLSCLCCRIKTSVKKEFKIKWDLAKCKCIVWILSLLVLDRNPIVEERAWSLLLSLYFFFFFILFFLSHTLFLFFFRTSIPLFFSSRTEWEHWLFNVHLFERLYLVERACEDQNYQMIQTLIMAQGL
jgi:hypothetical protein